MNDIAIALIFALVCGAVGFAEGYRWARGDLDREIAAVRAEVSLKNKSIADATTQETALARAQAAVDDERGQGSDQAANAAVQSAVAERAPLRDPTIRPDEIDAINNLLRRALP